MPEYRREHASAFRGRLQHPLQSLNSEWWRIVQSLRGATQPESEDFWNPAMVKLIDRSVHPLLETYFRGFATGMENIPDGPALFTGVHGGGLISPDLVLAASSFYRHTQYRRPFYGLMHRMLFAIPGWNRLLQSIGATEGSRPNAVRLLREGHAVAVFPGGEYDMARTFRRRNEVRFANRTGFVKVALESGAPIVPVGSIGGQGIFIVLTEGRSIARALNLKHWFDASTFPLCLSLPWGLTVSWIPCLPLPARLGVKFGKPMHFTAGRRERYDPMYLAYVRDAVETAVRRLIDDLLEGIGHPGRGVPPKEIS